MVFNFDLQRFDDEQPTTVEPTPETSENQEPIPEELGGLDEDTAREAMAEWKESQQETDPTQDGVAAVGDTVSRTDYQSKANEVEYLKAQLEQFRQREHAQRQAQQAPMPQVKITPEISAKLNEAIKAEAMAMTGFSEDDVASLDYADDDDPRLSQWSQARTIAQSNVIGAIRQAQQIQQLQAQQYIENQRAAIDSYNSFAQQEFKEPDFQNIQHFATNEFFSSLTPAEQKIIANSYLRIERQLASPAEMLVVKNYYEKAKAAYRGMRGRGQVRQTPQQQAMGLPRVDQLGGSAGKGEISAAELERMLDTTDFDKIPEVYQRKLLGY